VAFQFHRLGEIVVDTSKPGSEDAVLEIALDAGADDVQTEGAQTTVLCSPEVFESVKKALNAAGLVPLRADVVMRPENRVAVADDVAGTLRDLIDWLESLDDVQEVYHNAALPE
jgi:transcriptional/translational regulatory protein YebC/TACO1